MNPDQDRYKWLRLLALTVLLAGAVGAEAMTLYAGRNNKSWLLIVLFLGWVLSPFLGLLMAHLRSKTRTESARVILYSLMIVISIGSLFSYRGVFDPPGVANAFKFMITPLVSWMMMAGVYLIQRQSK